MYKPLPNNLTIHASAIHDIGIFAKEDIPEQTDLGMTHVELGKLMAIINPTSNESDFQNKTLQNQEKAQSQQKTQNMSILLL